jgi:glycosyltransferase involved in cell wall biosynthesis
MPILISTIILTKNEEKNIVDCIESVLFSDEIIVLDDDSSDRTKAIIENLSKEHTKIKFYTRKLNNDFSEQRRFGIDKAKNDWIFFVDADERITRELKNEIIENLDSNDQFSGYLIPRTDFIWGNKLNHGETGNIRLLRLFNKNEGNLKGIVHESWETKKPVGRLNNPILHYPHPTISEFLREINFYTDLRAEELYKNNKKVGFFSILFYPKAKFLKNYFFKLGIMDGVPGLIHAIIMSFHSFLVRGKLWLLWQKK